MRPRMDKMAEMSGRGAAGRAAAESQPDLFDERGLIDAGSVAVAARAAPEASADAAGLSDAALVALLPQASMSNVEALCSEVLSRRLATAVPALENLWRRFTGFGMRVPLVQQRAVLGTLARLEDAHACTALRGIVLSKGLPASLLPLAMRAAAEAALSLPAGFVGPLLAHEDEAVRAAAFALAPRAGVPVELLREALSDSSAPVRRLAAIALGVAKRRSRGPPRGRARVRTVGGGDRGADDDWGRGRNRSSRPVRREPSCAGGDRPRCPSRAG